MARFVAARLLAGVATMGAVSVLLFFGIDLLPGDPASAALGSSATPAQLAQYRAEFGLDRPLVVRYGDWLGGVLHGDLGRSFPSGTAVTELVGPLVGYTSLLAFLTLLVLVPVGVGLGIASGTREGRPADRAVSLLTLILAATPEFVIAAALIVVLAVWIPVFPQVSLIDQGRPVLGQLDVFAIPVLTLVAAGAAQTCRMVRACVIDVLEQPYIAMARLKGVPERQVVWRHVLPNALGPTLQVIAINLGWLFGGVVVVEAVVEFPGVGRALTQAVIGRDVAVVQSLALMITAVFVVGSVLADIAATALNPRLRGTL
ncbi:MAG: ABC transporter permease [Nocardioides sp.]|uniref:ABC transporter permease n=1 Tax=Nocardioides sp. TaxID=35761 RepID=UPI0039E52839